MDDETNKAEAATTVMNYSLGRIPHSSLGIAVPIALTGVLPVGKRRVIGSQTYRKEICEQTSKLTASKIPVLT